MAVKLSIFLRKAVKALTPYGILVLCRRIKEQRALRKLYGQENYCPICGKKSYFRPFGIIPRQKAQCLNCGSLERHRLLWLFFKKDKKLFGKENKILHIGAEHCFETRFKKTFKKNYLTADLNNPDAMVKMDITDIHYPDESFDIIICNHVLEHVPDDRKAMLELYRVIKKNGWAVLNVPMKNMDKTYEDFSITSKEDREKAFGQWDHVRMYGRDYIDRLKLAGFNVSVIKREDIASTNEINRMNLDSDIYSKEIFYCKK
jgi:SAM-dependent methyltransferase